MGMAYAVFGCMLVTAVYVAGLFRASTSGLNNDQRTARIGHRHRASHCLDSRV